MCNRYRPPGPADIERRWQVTHGLVIERADEDAWLRGTMRDAQALLRLAPVEVYDAGPA